MLVRTQVPHVSKHQHILISRFVLKSVRSVSWGHYTFRVHATLSSTSFAKKDDAGVPEYASKARHILTYTSFPNNDAGMYKYVCHQHILKLVISLTWSMRLFFILALTLLPPPLYTRKDDASTARADGDRVYCARGVCWCCDNVDLKRKRT
jgi:hypothetical protein